MAYMSVCVYIYNSYAYVLNTPQIREVPARGLGVTLALSLPTTAHGTLTSHQVLLIMAPNNGSELVCPHHAVPSLHP